MDKPTPREQEKYAESPAYQPEEHPQVKPWEWRAKHPQTGDVFGPWFPCSARAAERARACGYEVRVRPTFADGFEQALNDAYAEGREDEAEEHAWRPLETAPEDTHILVALRLGHYSIGWWVNEGDGVKWLHNGNPHSSLTPLAWMPLPKHPSPE